MNYRRGLLRLWLVLSALWVVVVAWISADSVQRSVEIWTSTSKPSAVGVDGSGIDWVAELYRLARSEGQGGPATELLNQLTPAERVMWQIDRSPRGALADKQWREQVAELIGQQARHQAPAELGIVGALALVPPLLLLVFMLTGLWVVAGFKRSGA